MVTDRGGLFCPNCSNSAILKCAYVGDMFACVHIHPLITMVDGSEGGTCSIAHKLGGYAQKSSCMNIKGKPIPIPTSQHCRGLSIHPKVYAEEVRSARGRKCWMHSIRIKVQLRATYYCTSTARAISCQESDSCTVRHKLTQP